VLEVHRVVCCMWSRTSLPNQNTWLYLYILLKNHVVLTMFCQCFMTPCFQVDFWLFFLFDCLVYLYIFYFLDLVWKIRGMFCILFSFVFYCINKMHKTYVIHWLQYPFWMSLFMQSLYNYALSVPFPHFLWTMDTDLIKHITMALFLIGRCSVPMDGIDHNKPKKKNFARKYYLTLTTVKFNF